MKAILETVVNVLIGLAAIVVIAGGVYGFIKPTPVPAPARAGGPPVPETVEAIEVDLDNAVVRKNGNAKTVVIEFADFECSFCARHARQTLSQIISQYVDRGAVAYAFVNFPLEQIHNRAFRAAEAAQCANEQGRYWEMHSRLFDNQRALSEPDLRTHAKAIGIDNAAFQSCLESGRADQIRRHLAQGEKLGVTSTPTFFVGEFTDNGSVRVTRRLRGAAPFPSFSKMLEDILKAPRT